jgi:hypothetical protein
MEQNNGKLELIAIQKVQATPEMYKVVDFLNKNLKGYHLMFGLTKKEEKMTISIYEVE